MKKKLPGFSQLGLVLAAALTAAGGIVAVSAGPAQAAVAITLNGSSAGRTFDGVGAVSGGGGNSRLLIDYPEPQRGQILDYLFKPGYGAALQMLKVEIGGDTNSTSGAEPSHSHFRGDLDCNRGYEWWIMEQAKARNPNIRLAALPWGAPGWIGNGTFLSSDLSTYLLSWLGCAKQHGLNLDYIVPAQNERQWNAATTINVRNALNANGYSSVKIEVAEDWTYGPADQMVTNTALRNAVDAIGVHYSCGYLTDQKTCNSSANGINSGKALWSSENGSQDYNGGAKPLARGINRVYLDAKMTNYTNWDLIASTTPNNLWGTVGLLLANQPWHGGYSVGKNVWAIAHTTQFTTPGWRYLDSSSGYLGGNRNNGSFVTLRSPSTGDYSTVIETMDATADQVLDFTLTGGLSTGAVHVWATNLNSSNTSDFFVRRSDVTPSGGRFSLTVQPGYQYTITTTTGQGKGTAASSGSGSLALPYADGFDGYATGREAKYLMDMQGAFEIAACGGGRSGQCVRQASTQAPITWKDLSDPYAELGSTTWTNYSVQSDVMLEKTGYVELMGRVRGQALMNPAAVDAYHFRVSDSGAWSILRTNSAAQTATLSSGTTSSLGTNRWHTLTLTFSGSTLTAKVNGTTVGSVTDSSFSSGLAGIATSQGQTAQFDNFQVYTGSPVTITTTTTTTTTSSPGTTTTTTTSSPATTTTTTSSATTTSTTGGGSGCTAAFSAPNPWPGGFVGNVTVTAGQALTGWRVTINLPSGVSVTNVWNATLNGSTGTVTASNVSYNGTVAVGQSTQFGFQANGAPSGTTVSCSPA